jgi:aryl-phospho-beta-D-glucosidase BglC (GH1 family)
MQTEFANFWNVVTSQFNDTEYVLGYELINEPVQIKSHNLFFIPLVGWRYISST